MKKVFRYYVVDTLTESVVGSFFALNKDVANKILTETYKKNEKLQQVGDSLKLVYDTNSYTELETYQEVMDVCLDTKWIPVELPYNE